MFGFFKMRNKNANDNAKKEVRESPEIAKARKYLESVYGERAFHYMETSEEEAYKRYHFYQGPDKRLIYVVLSDEERNEITKAFKEKMGDSYAYQDTILSSMTGNVAYFLLSLKQGENHLNIISKNSFDHKLF